MLFLINLDDAAERRARMEAQLRALNLAWQRIGVDLRGRDPAAIDTWVDAHLPGFRFDHASVSSAEIGCWVSHVVAWRALAARDDAKACVVLEDDLALGAGLPQAIAALSQRPVFDLVFLGTSCRNVSGRRRMPAGGFGLHAPIGTIYYTWGYVVSRDWVRRFLGAGPWRITHPIDHYTGGRRAKSLKPRAAVLRPAVVEEDATLGPRSQIEPYTFRIDRSRLVEVARRRLLASRISALYYRLYRFL
jgi:glycosyl transferase family 25